VIKMSAFEGDRVMLKYGFTSPDEMRQTKNRIILSRRSFITVVSALGIAATVAILLRQGISRMPVGVNTWFGTTVALLNQRDSPLLNQAGIRQIRLGGVNDQNLAQYDSLVNALVADGIEVLGILHRADLASDHNAFGDYAYNTVLHFKGRVRNWEVWNEPDWNPATSSPYFTPSDYADLLKNAYTRAKQADPNSFITSGGISTVEGGLPYVKAIYDSGGKDFMDAVAVHPYCFPAAPSDPHGDPYGHTFCGLPTIRNLMTSYGDVNKKVWITEFGYRTPGVGFTAGDAKGTVTEQQQASYIEQALTMASGWDWVERFYIYAWMDSSDPSMGCFGLIRETYETPFETKPAFGAVEAFVASEKLQ
jgi:exo-beta-1,3-glucanase (GH17 family)